MRESKCALNLPTVIGQTLPSPVAKPGPNGIGPQSRRPNSPLAVVMAGSRVSLVSLGGTYSTALFAMMSTAEWSLSANGLSFLLASTFPMDQADSGLSLRAVIFCAEPPNSVMNSRAVSVGRSTFGSHGQVELQDIE